VFRLKAYKFIKFDAAFFSKEPSADYHNIIIEHAAMGWELVQIFSPAISSHGRPKYYELIFARESDDPAKESEYTDLYSTDGNAIAKTVCPECGLTHDIDYPRCPKCGHDYCFYNWPVFLWPMQVHPV